MIAKKESIIHKANEYVNDFNNLFLIWEAKIIRKIVFIPPIIGTIVVAWTATCGFWVQPMNIKPKSKVEGNPAINPPIFVPYLSAIIVAAKTHAPPIRNESTTFNKKILSIFELYLKPFLFS